MRPFAMNGGGLSMYSVGRRVPCGTWNPPSIIASGMSSDAGFHQESSISRTASAPVRTHLLDDGDVCRRSQTRPPNAPALAIDAGADRSSDTSDGHRSSNASAFDAITFCTDWIGLGQIDWVVFSTHAQA